MMKTAVRTKARLLHSRKDGVFIETVAKLSMKCMKMVEWDCITYLTRLQEPLHRRVVSLVHPLVHTNEGSCSHHS